MTPLSIKPTHKAIQAYYDALKGYDAQDVRHETAVRSAFQNLLAETAKLRKWNLVPELSMKVKGGSIRPDGTLRDDDWQLPRGFWEAKDTGDTLNDEIKKKVAKGYPLVNTIFEDTRHGVFFFQNGFFIILPLLRPGLDRDRARRPCCFSSSTATPRPSTKASSRPSPSSRSASPLSPRPCSTRSRPPTRRTPGSRPRSSRSWRSAGRR